METIIQRAREAHPGVTPRIISDNGPQFIAKDFKEFIRVAGMTHVKTSPYYPQSNGKIERWHRTLKGDCIRVKVPLSLVVVQHVTLPCRSTRLANAANNSVKPDTMNNRLEQLSRPVRPSISPPSARSSAWPPSCNCSAAVPTEPKPPSSADPVRSTAQPRLRQPRSPRLPVLQVRPLGQRPRPLGRGERPDPLRCRHRPVHIPVPTLPPQNRNREEEPVAPSDSVNTMPLP